MGAKDWSPLAPKYMIVSGTMDDKIEDSDLVIIGAADLQEVDRQVDQGMGMGADVFFIFERTEIASIWDSERGRYVERPAWKLIRAF